MDGYRYLYKSIISIRCQLPDAFADLSQKALGKSAVSRRMAKGIVPVAPTGTRGRRPSMEDTGITYKTCAC